MGTVDGVVVDHVQLALPYTVSNEELDFTVAVLKKAYEKTVLAAFNAKM